MAPPSPRGETPPTAPLGCRPPARPPARLREGPPVRAQASLRRRVFLALGKAHFEGLKECTKQRRCVPPHTDFMFRINGKEPWRKKGGIF